MFTAYKLRALFLIKLTIGHNYKGVTGGVCRALVIGRKSLRIYQCNLLIKKKRNYLPESLIRALYVIK